MARGWPRPNLREKTQMTDMTLDMKEQIARIDRNQAELAKLFEEAQKFTAESHKLMAERLKLDAEEQKLRAEADKLRRDHGFAPYALALGAVGGAAGLIVALSALLKNMGVL